MLGADVLDEVFMLAARDEMRDDLGVGGGLEDAALALELVAHLRRVDEVAVVREREVALAEGEDERLRVRRRAAILSWSSGRGRWPRGRVSAARSVWVNASLTSPMPR